MKARLAPLLAGVVLWAACASPPELPVLPVGGNFTLTSHEGRAFDSSSLRGRVALVFFGYTFCPDVCPVTLSKIAAVRRALGDDASRVATVYITVDPGRDTPDALRAYLSHFSVDAVGLTGTQEQIAQVAHQFGAAYEIEQGTTEDRYLVAHTTTLYGVDPSGRTRVLFGYTASVDEIVTGIRAML